MITNFLTYLSKKKNSKSTNLYYSCDSFKFCENFNDINLSNLHCDIKPNFIKKKEYSLPLTSFSSKWKTYLFGISSNP